MSAPYVALVDAGPMGSRSSQTVRSKGAPWTDFQTIRRPGSASATSNSTSHPNGPNRNRSRPRAPTCVPSPCTIRASVTVIHSGCRTMSAAYTQTSCADPRSPARRRTNSCSSLLRLDDRQRAGDHRCEARRRRPPCRPASAPPPRRPRRASARVGPTEPETRPASAARDRPLPRPVRRRDGEAPGDAVVGLPVDDLFEGRKPAGHALGGRPDAATAAGGRLLDDERSLPRVRSAGDVRCAQTTDGSAASVAWTSKARSVSAMSSRRMRALHLPASLEIQGERRDVTEMLDLLARLGARGHGIESQGLDGGGREQGEPLARASAAPVPFRRRWATMTSEPASSSRPAMLTRRTPRGGRTPSGRVGARAGTSCNRSSSPGRCSAGGAGRRHRPPRSHRGAGTRRRARLPRRRRRRRLRT